MAQGPTQALLHRLEEKGDCGPSKTRARELRQENDSDYDPTVEEWDLPPAKEHPRSWYPYLINPRLSIRLTFQIGAL